MNELIGYITDGLKFIRDHRLIIKDLIIPLLTIAGSGIVTYKLNSNKSDRDFKLKKLEDLTKCILHVNRLAYRSLYDYAATSFVTGTLNPVLPKSLTTGKFIEKGNVIVNIYFPNLKSEYDNFLNIEGEMRTLSLKFEQCGFIFNSMNSLDKYKCLYDLLAKSKGKLLSLIFEESRIIRDYPILINLPIIRHITKAFQSAYKSINSILNKVANCDG